VLALVLSLWHQLNKLLWCCCDESMCLQVIRSSLLMVWQLHLQLVSKFNWAGKIGQLQKPSIFLDLAWIDWPIREPGHLSSSQKTVSTYFFTSKSRKIIFWAKILMSGRIWFECTFEDWKLWLFKLTANILKMKNNNDLNVIVVLQMITV
jgi:hypothetical protein